MNKRGVWKEIETMKVVFYAFMVVLVSFFLILGFSFSVPKVKPFQIEKGIVYSRLFSTDCLGYRDSEGMIRKGIIEFENLDGVVLERCMGNLDEKEIGLRLTLRSFEKEDVLKVVELNKEMVSNRVYCTIKNPGYGYICDVGRAYVLYYDNDELKQGLLDILVVGKDE
jgi:hypothetical protein